MNKLASFVASEINRLHAELCAIGKMSIEKAVRIGELLIGIKEELDHGEWLRWLKANISFSQRTAYNYIGLYEHREKFAKFANLTDAYALLMDKQRKRSERTAREKKHKTDKEEQAKLAPLVADEYRSTT
jgi:hypothetical protein